MSPGTYRFALPSFLFLYCAFGFLTHSRFGGREIFPVFSWALYSEAPAVEVQYAARLLEIDGRVLSPPVELLTTRAFHAGPDYWLDAGTVAAFGRALDEGDTARAGPLRDLVEGNVLPGRKTRYEMVRRVYDPLARRATGSYSESSLGIFQMHDTPDQDR